MAYLTVEETAAALGISKQRVYQLILSGRLQAEKAGRFWLVDSESVNERQQTAPRAGRPQLSSPAKNRKYTLMNRTHEVLAFEYDKVHRKFSDSKEVYDPSRAPVGMLSSRGQSVSGASLAFWWEHRSIPSSRTGIDLKLEQLGLVDPAQIPFESLGLSLSDQYWIRPFEDDHLQWESLNFFHNDFGTFESQSGWMSSIGLQSPDNTSEGMLSKRWVCKKNGMRSLLKGSGTLNQEPYNEVVASSLHRRLLKTEEYVTYRLEPYDGQTVCACDCFVSDDEEYIPAHSVMKLLRQEKHHSAYQHYIECCIKLGVDDIEKSLSKMIITDDLLANTDRHLRNFGLVRNVETLECRPAPLFDTGSSLWASTPTSELLKGNYDFTTKPFKEKPVQQFVLANDISWLEAGALDGLEEEARTVFEKSDLPAERIDAIVEGLHQRVERIQRIFG